MCGGIKMCKMNEYYNHAVILISLISKKKLGRIL